MTFNRNENEISKYYLVNIEFKRIQTFLFAVPRLKDMLGANALLGETIRNTLPLKVNGKGMKLDDEAILSQLPPVIEDDPLNFVGQKSYLNKDDPALMFKDGILSRDGGHFSVVFAKETDADEFIENAEELLLKDLPGLLFEINKMKCPDVSSNQDQFQGKNDPRNMAREQFIVDLPQFQVCQESGAGPASQCYVSADKTSKWISLPVYKKKIHGIKFNNKETSDIVGLLESSQGLFPLSELKPPNDFAQLCQGDYLATIVVDGNDMGIRFNEWKKKYPETQNINDAIRFLRLEAYGERFWYKNRVNFRMALVKALNSTFTEKPKSNIRPYQLLMLGGDDLLMVCQASYALGFVKNFAQSVDEVWEKETEIPKQTIGAGVLIASPSFPFHRLHAMTEQLAGSAKRLYRSLDKARQCSTVDWMICTASWSDDPIEMRKRLNIIEYQGRDGKEVLILSRKPYPILKKDAGSESLDSLESLLEEAGKLTMGNENNRAAARTQLKRIMNEIPKGRMWANLVYKKLKDPTGPKLRKIIGEGLWCSRESPFKTRINDLIEITDISYLGAKAHEWR